MFLVMVGGGGGVWVRSGQALSSISASKGVIISHPGVTGAKTVIWREGGKWRQNVEEDVVVQWRAIRRRTWRQGALKPCPGNRAGLPQAIL